VTLDLTPAQFQALVGLLDIAIKQVGIRAFEDDVAGLMAAVKAAVSAQEDIKDAA
jgi:hypothetical protein